MLDKQFLFCFCLGQEYRFDKTDESSVLNGLRHIMPSGVMIIPRIRYLVDCTEDVYFGHPQILEGVWDGIILYCNFAFRLQYFFSSAMRRNGQISPEGIIERAPVLAFAIGKDTDCSKININLFTNPNPKLSQQYRFERFDTGLSLIPFLDNFIL